MRTDLVSAITHVEAYIYAHSHVHTLTQFEHAVSTTGADISGEPARFGIGHRGQIGSGGNGLLPGLFDGRMHSLCNQHPQHTHTHARTSHPIKHH